MIHHWFKKDDCSLLYHSHKTNTTLTLIILFEESINHHFLQIIKGYFSPLNIENIFFFFSKNDFNVSTPLLKRKRSPWNDWLQRQFCYVIVLMWILTWEQPQIATWLGWDTLSLICQFFLNPHLSRIESFVMQEKSRSTWIDFIWLETLVRRLHVNHTGSTNSCKNGGLFATPSPRTLGFQAQRHSSFLSCWSHLHERQVEERTCRCKRESGRPHEVRLPARDCRIWSIECRCRNAQAARDKCWTNEKKWREKFGEFSFQPFSTYDFFSSTHWAQILSSSTVIISRGWIHLGISNLNKEIR